MQLSARNQLKGKVKSVKTGAIMAEVIVDVGGQDVVAAITHESVNSLGLKAGEDVIVVVKSTDVMVAKG